MTERDRPWYLEPETFIALAALVVSVTAVVVGVYEAALQRAHDRAEVWPRIEISTYTTPRGAALYLENDGIGPALVKSIIVRLDGRVQHNWQEVLTPLIGHPPSSTLETSTVAEHAVRAGDRVTLIGVPSAELPHPFWTAVGRVSVTVCYGSVFNEYWLVSTPHLGSGSVWTPVKACPPQPQGVDF